MTKDGFFLSLTSSLLLAILKLLGIMPIGWGWVLAPMWIPALVGLLPLIIFLIWIIRK